MNYWQRLGIVLMFLALLGVSSQQAPLVFNIATAFIGSMLFLAPWKKGWD